MWKCVNAYSSIIFLICIALQIVLDMDNCITCILSYYLHHCLNWSRVPIVNINYFFLSLCNRVFTSYQKSFSISHHSCTTGHGLSSDMAINWQSKFLEGVYVQSESLDCIKENRLASYSAPRHIFPKINFNCWYFNCGFCK